LASLSFELSHHKWGILKKGKFGEQKILLGQRQQKVNSKKWPSSPRLNEAKSANLRRPHCFL